MGSRDGRPPQAHDPPVVQDDWRLVARLPAGCLRGRQPAVRAGGRERPVHGTGLQPRGRLPGERVLAGRQVARVHPSRRQHERGRLLVRHRGEEGTRRHAQPVHRKPRGADARRHAARLRLRPRRHHAAVRRRPRPRQGGPGRSPRAGAAEEGARREEGGAGAAARGRHGNRPSGGPDHAGRGGRPVVRLGRREAGLLRQQRRQGPRPVLGGPRRPGPEARDRRGLLGPRAHRGHQEGVLHAGRRNLPDGSVGREEEDEDPGERHREGGQPRRVAADLRRMLARDEVPLLRREDARAWTGPRSRQSTSRC